MCASYRPDLSAGFIQQQLGFSNLKECITFLKLHQATIIGGSKMEIDPKAWLPILTEKMKEYDKA